MDKTECAQKLHSVLMRNPRALLEAGEGKVTVGLDVVRSIQEAGLNLKELKEHGLIEVIPGVTDSLKANMTEIFDALDPPTPRQLAARERDKRKKEEGPQR